MLVSFCKYMMELVLELTLLGPGSWKRCWNIQITFKPSQVIYYQAQPSDLTVAQRHLLGVYDEHAHDHIFKLKF